MDDALLEAISEKVHEAWADEKIRQGFADHAFDYVKCWNLPKGPSPCQLQIDQHHADMIPYADLAESTKDYDRATVRAVFGAIESAGYQIVPVPSAALHGAGSTKETPTRV